LVWTPSPAVRERARLTPFMRWLRETHGLAFDDYDSLWRWSVTEIEAFWDAIRAYFDVRFDTPARQVLTRREMPGARWFEGATLNYVQQVF
ncbi:hypothetical protein OH413_25085, partial [Salmonella enterica]|nr:hypothetical protein [Salmonella enterica]